MAIKYAIQQINRKGVTPDSMESKYYAQAKYDGVTSQADIAQMVSQISAISVGDVLSVMNTVSMLLSIELANGRIVELGDLGRFRATLRSKSCNKPEEFNYYEKQLFDYFVQAYMPKGKKVIKNIELIYNGFSAKDLSEGEKKLILIRSILSFVADENSLILFDEPDANIHEGRKQQLYNLFSEYCKYDRQMIVATHSPILAQLANEKELLMLELDEGKSTILTDEKIEKIKKLSGTSWDVIGQGMMLRSSRPLVVFEGKTDVMYVKRAFEMLKSRSDDYATLNVDFLNANGAGNVKSFIDNLKSFVPDSKKIIILFDRDNAGKDGARAVTGISKDDERVAHYQDIVQDNITTSFIPYKDGVTEGDFLIEDYFSWDDTIKAIVEDVIPDRKHPIKMLPNLPDKIKKELEKRINKFEADEFNGFIPLLDKIVELTKEQAV